MNKDEYRKFLDLLMCSDPWPIEDDGEEGQQILQDYADRKAKEYGWSDWIEAYHQMI